MARMAVICVGGWTGTWQFVTASWQTNRHYSTTGKWSTFAWQGQKVRFLTMKTLFFSIGKQLSVQVYMHFVYGEH